MKRTAIFFLILGGAMWACGGSSSTGGAGSGGDGGAVSVGSGGTSVVTSSSSDASSGVGGGGAGGAGQGGNGGSPPASCLTPDDCPGADSTCLTRTCDNDICGAEYAAKGVPCSDADGTLCSGAGQCVPWANLSLDGAPSARFGHSAVWTGSHMIVWGGATGPGQVTDSGYRYDPVDDSWTPISTQGAPEARRGHAAGWSGAHMLIWGGFGANGYAPDGGRYNPATDTWSSMSTNNQPSPRTKFSATWDYNHQYWIVWGGLFNTTVLGNGSRYHAPSNTWVPVPAANAPSPRFAYSAAWVPPQQPNAPNGAMVIFGGTNTFDWLLDGAMLDPVALSWTAINMTPGAMAGGAPPSAPLESSAAILLGGSLLIWGGWDGGNYYGDGYYLFPNDKPGGFWYGVQQQGAPSSRSAMLTLHPGFTGMFIWGGCGGMACSTIFDDGGLWTYGSNGGTWKSIPSDPALSARVDATAVSTGIEAIVWGGRVGTNAALGDGARRAINPP